jgi:hypothetical protein
LVVDWGGKVAAWFAAVTAGSAALAALIVTAPHAAPLHGWLHAAFIALLVIGSVSFVFLLLTGPPALLAARRAPRGGLLAAPGSPALERSAVPPFELHYYSRPGPPEYGGWVTSHYIAIRNPPGQPVRRVYVTQDGMNPEPRFRPPQGPGRPSFPYYPPCAGGGDGRGVIIQPGQEESWLLGYTGTGGEEGNWQMSVFNFNVTNHATLYWQLYPDESWRLSYHVRCDGVDAEMPFSIVVDSLDGKTIRVRQQG